MKRSTTIILLCAALPLVGCDSSRAPRFQLSEQSLELSSFAQEKVQGELSAGFGSPAELVVWPELEVDFGQFGGTIGKVGPRPGTIRIGQSVEEGLVSQSDLGVEDLLAELKGAAVVITKASAPADGKSQSGEGEAESRQRRLRVLKLPFTELTHTLLKLDC